MPLTKAQIRERLKRTTVTVTTTGVNIFTSPVPENVLRNIVRIEAAAGATAVTIRIRRVTEANVVAEPLTPAYNIPANGNFRDPETFDIEQPLIVIPGGENINGISTGASVDVTLLYWDDEIH